eukprot:GABW01005026.1.p2 GENE.GABW01005026.1~~GABW01005026.1.p2  ORF type:complete len:81 (+),score=25.84 GABW01005026.1:40-282(+)
MMMSMILMMRLRGGGGGGGGGWGDEGAEMFYASDHSDASSEAGSMEEAENMALDEMNEEEDSHYCNGCRESHYQGGIRRR